MSNRMRRKSLKFPLIPVLKIMPLRSPHPTLIGTIEYRLKLDNGASRSSSKKRQKKCAASSSDADKNDTTLAGKKRSRLSPVDGDAGTNNSTIEWVHNAGYFFVPRRSHGDQGHESRHGCSSRGCPIVYPFASIDTICRAAVASDEVAITRYQWIVFGSADSDMNEDTTVNNSQGASNDAPEFSARVLEIHGGGINNVSDNNGTKLETDHDQTDQQQDEKIMNLTEFATMENERRSGGKGSQGNSSTERYSIVAKIDAASAIIAAVPSDPFALVELYEEGHHDDDYGPLSAVAVLRGRSALAVHEALHPGRTVAFKRVRRQRWHVPKSFEDVKLGVAASDTLKDRAPTHVFVVDDGRSISLSSADGDEEYASDRENDGFPPLPSTAVPLHAIQGKVLSVRRASMGAAGETIHSVLIACADGIELTSRRCKLYMTYYPISPALVWGLRVGATVRAVNIYSVNSGAWAENRAFGTCRVLAANARSTVVVMNASSDADKSTTPRQVPQNAVMSPTRCNPYSFISTRRRNYGEMEWRERLRTFWYDKSGLFADSDAPKFEELSRNLLVQYKTSTGLMQGKCSESEADRSLRKKRAKRDPYVEFFEQACDAITAEDMQQPVLSPRFPIMLPLKRIRDACIDRFKSSVNSICTVKPSDSAFVDEGRASLRNRIPVQSGWTASKCFDESDIRREILMHEPGHDDAPSSLYACGIAGEKLSSLRDGSCQLPVCLASNDDDPSHVKVRLQASFGMNVKKGTCLALPVHSVVVSCICLGPMPRDSSPDDATNYLPVPTALTSTEITGGCALFVASGLMFIASTHIRWVGPQTVTSKAGNKLLKSVQESVDCSISQSDASTSNTFIVGRLVRQRFALRRLQHGAYKGCVLTLSHVPLAGSKKESSDVNASTCVCDLQSIELKLSARNIPNAVTRQMRQAFRHLFQDTQDIGQHEQHTAVVSHVVNDDQIGLATSWWTLAEDARFSSLLCGGRDESQTREGMLSSTYLRFPLASREASSRGYMRFKCSVDDIVAFSARLVESGGDVYNTRRSLRGTDEFDWIGGEKFLPGMLDRLPERNGRFPTGDRLIFPPESVSGISSHTLAQLHWNICQDLNNRARSSIAPSLVRRVTGARLLGVTFCRARAECTRCFQFLCRRDHRKSEARNEPTSGVVTSVRVPMTPCDDSEEGTSTYWHLPMDFEGCSGPSPKPKGSLSTYRPTANKRCRIDRPRVNTTTIRTNLRCPNECPIDFASIKWECSGVIDDGTAQAKLHAEREAALALIGSELDVESVEAGAWTVERGITFQKSVPPRSFILNSVREAQMMAHHIARDSPKPKERKNLRASNVLRLLTPEAKAEYTLQSYCRFSTEAVRCIDIIYRCKPISDEVEDLNRTDIEVTTARCGGRQEAVVSDAITYTLPPLKLNLVDVCAVQRMKREEGWSLVRALTGGSTA